MGTVSPVVAKLAVERVRRSDQTGRAIGQVYAWGMVGSILGTFLAGFVLIDVLGTKGLLLVLGTSLAFAATMLGSIWHAAWAGIPLGLCVIAFVPSPWFERQGLAWGLREEKGNPATTEDALAWVDESDYYFIKVSNEPDADGQKRTLVLDNLIHGYFILDHPERLDYDYEHIYALVTRRVADAKAKADTAAGKAAKPLSTLFLGGGAYTFQRYVQHTYPGAGADVAEIDPAVTYANHKALGLPLDTTIKTTWGDARQFVEKPQGTKQYDLIYGDAFNDFSVPWHLTTREFNDKLARMMSPNGVYMINIIDAYESDDTAAENARTEIDEKKITDPAAKARVKAARLAKARRYGAFLGAWVNTARQTFPHVAIFGTDDNPGSGLRETFVVLASKQPIKINDLGSREDDPQFFQASDDRLFEPRPFGPEHLKAIDLRSRGIVLTDDYAPVENLLAPVAATRGED
jgi:spermidine synthase